MGALDDLRQSIKVRDFKPSGFNDPVTEFKGKFTSVDTEAAMFDGKETGRTNVILHFGDVEIIASDEPYPYPVKDVAIAYTERGPSRWTIFADSVCKFIRDDQHFVDLIGARLHLKMETYKLFQGKERGVQPTGCWTVAGIEGGTAGNGRESGLSVEKQLLMLLNGRTEQAFNMEALRSPVVKADSGVTTRILNKTWLVEVVAKGLVVKDDTGTFSLTPTGVEELQK